jgi:hypothetical protein
MPLVFSDSSFLESKVQPLEAPAETQWIEQYDYDSDSDLGYLSADEDGDGNVASSTITSPAPKGGGKCFSSSLKQTFSSFFLLY